MTCRYKSIRNRRDWKVFLQMFGNWDHVSEVAGSRNKNSKSVSSRALPEVGPGTKIKTCRVASAPTRANPSGSIFLPTIFPNYENTRFLGHFEGGDGVRFRLPLIGQTVGSRSRTSDSLSYGLRPRHTRGITYAGRWFLSPSAPHLPSLSLFLSRYLPAPTPFPVHSISGPPLLVLHHVWAATRAEKARSTLYERASALACCPPQKYPETHPTTLRGTHQ